MADKLQDEIPPCLREILEKKQIQRFCMMLTAKKSKMI